MYCLYRESFISKFNEKCSTITHNVCKTGISRLKPLNVIAKTATTQVLVVYLLEILIEILRPLLGVLVLMYVDCVI